MTTISIPKEGEVAIAQYNIDLSENTKSTNISSLNRQFHIKAGQRLIINSGINVFRPHGIVNLIVKESDRLSTFGIGHDRRLSSITVPVLLLQRKFILADPEESAHEVSREAIKKIDSARWEGLEVT